MKSWGAPELYKNNHKELKSISYWRRNRHVMIPGLLNSIEINMKGLYLQNVLQ